MRARTAGGGLARGAALHPGVIQRQLGQVVRLAVVQSLFEEGAVVEQVVAGLEAVVGGRHHLFFVLVEKLQHLLRGAVAGEAVDVVADGGVEGAEGLVQRLKVAGYLPQDVLVGALLFAHVLQKLPRLVELAGVGDDPGVQDLFQRLEKRRHPPAQRPAQALLRSCRAVRPASRCAAAAAESPAPACGGRGWAARPHRPRRRRPVPEALPARRSNPRPGIRPRPAGCCNLPCGGTPPTARAAALHKMPGSAPPAAGTAAG